MPRVTETANRWLLLLLVAFVCLTVPTGAGAQRPVTIRPSVSLTPNLQGTRGSNGWYVSNVLLSWTFVPNPPLTVQGCFVGAITAQGHTHIDCKASWGSSGSAEVVLDIYIDKTPPTVHAVPSRRPNANGWYTKPVSIAFHGTDATSGIAACSSTTYSGPDSSAASVAGTCTDKAGNVGHAVYRFAYDGTPPTVGSVTAVPGDRSVLLRWKTSNDTRFSEVTRSGGSTSSHKVVYRAAGTEVRDKGLRVGTKYKYTVTAFDEAGNTSNATLAVTATGPLTAPFPSQRVGSRPHLSWLPVKGASYYNVQLWRGGRILSEWPKRPTLKLPAKWAYQGHRHHLHRGAYRWYVWPGFGKRAKARYGRLLGSSSFVFAR